MWSFYQWDDLGRAKASISRIRTTPARFRSITDSGGLCRSLPRNTEAAMFSEWIETVDTSGAFRKPFKSKRYLIPADGYFEWTTSAQDGGKDSWLLQLPRGKAFLRRPVSARRQARQDQLLDHYRDTIR